jgi:hypothetical protein
VGATIERSGVFALPWRKKSNPSDRLEASLLWYYGYLGACHNQIPLVNCAI